MDDIKAKQQVVEKIKEASKILVTVSDSPSVDALSAALGLTLLFDKQEKYATAIFSGEVPPAIAFLEPEKTFDDTTDSLRDFIIALNKEKADHLRYKVEGDSVKIFITPYKTTISQDDLNFSQGDYNVELVIALGVDNQDHLDKALEDHGQILHDATVITISAGDQSSDLGGIDWHDANASSLSEMVAGLAEALKEDKKSLVDAPIATALLTGIVAETERFSNQHTTSKAMTVAAQLMTAGADQQLIATELEVPAPHIEEVAEEEVQDEPETTKTSVKEKAPSNKNELLIAHDEVAPSEPKQLDDAANSDDETLAELDERVRAKDEEPEETQEPETVEEPEVVADVEETPEEAPVEEPPVDETPQAVPAEEPEISSEPTAEPVEVPAPTPVEQPHSSYVSAPADASNAYTLEEKDLEPSLGGTLSATSEQAAEDAHREAMSGQNKTILSHAYLGSDAAQTQVSNPIGTDPMGFPGTPEVAPGSTGINEVAEEVHSAYAPVEDVSTGSAATSAPTFGVSGEKVITPLPSVPVAPIDLGLPLPPPLPDFSQGPLAPPIFPVSPPTLVTPSLPDVQPVLLGDILAPEPTGIYSSESTSESSNDPGQFKIPS